VLPWDCLFSVCQEWPLCVHRSRSEKESLHFSIVDSSPSTTSRAHLSYSILVSNHSSSSSYIVKKVFDFHYSNTLISFEPQISCSRNAFTFYCPEAEFLVILCPCILLEILPPAADLRPRPTMHPHNRGREKGSGQAIQFNIGTIWAMDRTSAQPQVELSLLRSNSLKFQPQNVLKFLSRHLEKLCSKVFICQVLQSLI
jgi:hypothetical protein